MAQIALPRHQATQSQSSGMGSPLYQRRQQSNAGPIELIPNPDFSFPMRGPDTTSPELASPSTRPMSLQAYPTGRRGSMPHARQKSINALPDFSFNPSGAPTPGTGSSPPQSPSAIPIPGARQTPGHRRGGSEFIGGDARPGGSALMSSSPTKGDGVLPPPSNTLRPGPPPGRRGHAHRRSGALSSHDLSSIMSPPAPALGGSAPATPSEGNEFAFGHRFNRSISQPSLREPSPEEDSRPPSRARVGFSDRVEYIRPLSTISSETETSMSTIRGHSATNSLSSIVGSSSPQAARIGRPLSTVEDESRPSTAGAVLDKFISSPLRVEPADRKRPMSAVSPTTLSATTTRATTKRRGFFRLDSRRSDQSVRTLSSSASDPSLSQTASSPLESPAVDDSGSLEETDKSKSASRKSSRKPRKVKSWANSIIPGKKKHSKKSKARAATPPPESIPDAEDSDESDDLDFEPNFDEDTTVTIVSPTDSVPPESKDDQSIASWQPRPGLKRVDSDIMSPIIDLDAALGPFNTPNGSAPRKQQRGFSAHRRAMHSANGTPSHRRTESAPELAPFERSSATAIAAPMADVFEEEEPEEEAVSTKGSKPASVAEEPEVPKVSVVESDSKVEGPAINWNFNDGLGIKRTERGFEPHTSEPLSPTAVSTNALHEHTSRDAHESGVVEVVEDYEEPRTSSLTHSSDSTVTPQPTVEEPKEQQPVMNLTLPLSQQSLMTPDTFTSSFPSPDYRSSQASFDTPRIGTAASSMSDYPVMPSPRFGEPGPELRISVDDVPSLTSSRSTMTSAMQHAFALPSPRRPGERTASLCSDPSELESRRRKRSSIASLSRLINSSSHGERSKLSIEQRPQSEYLEPSKDKKKSNRLSKLKFWKSSRDLASSARS